VEAILFTEHFAGYYFPHRLTIFVFISLDNSHRNQFAHAFGLHKRAGHITLCGIFSKLVIALLASLGLSLVSMKVYAARLTVQVYSVVQLGHGRN
jgi:hypothetical protein